MITPPELSRPLTLEDARRTSRPIVITADADERAALARRFDLIAIDRLEAELLPEVQGDELRLTGTLTARATQRCVATGTPVKEQVSTPLSLRCVPLARLEAAEAEAEVELDSADLDVIGYERGAVDLGEIVAESLVLALDPWPRSANATAWLKAQGVKAEDEVERTNAFSALAGLRDQLKKGE